MKLIFSYAIHSYLEAWFTLNKSVKNPYASTGLDIKQIFKRKIVYISLHISFNIFWVLKRIVSLRRFFWVPTTYVLVEK